jgi:hypothetical protein
MGFAKAFINLCFFGIGFDIELVIVRDVGLFLEGSAISVRLFPVSSTVKMVFGLPLSSHLKVIEDTIRLVE